MYVSMYVCMYVCMYLLIAYKWKAVEEILMRF
jgi:hypothetical protein